MGAAAYKTCSALCFLNAGTAYFISMCFQRQIASLAIPCILNSWDPSEKARACFHASVFYLVIAVGLWIVGVWRSYFEENSENLAALDGPYSESFLALPGNHEMKWSAKEEEERRKDTPLVQRLVRLRSRDANGLSSKKEEGGSRSGTNTASTDAASSIPQRLMNYGSLTKRTKE